MSNRIIINGHECVVGKDGSKYICRSEGEDKMPELYEALKLDYRSKTISELNGIRYAKMDMCGNKNHLNYTIDPNYDALARSISLPNNSSSRISIDTIAVQKDKKKLGFLIQFEHVSANQEMISITNSWDATMEADSYIGNFNVIVPTKFRFTDKNILEQATLWLDTQYELIIQKLIDIKCKHLYALKA